MARRGREDEEGFSSLSLTRTQRLGQSLAAEEEAKERDKEIHILSLTGRLAVRDYREEATDPKRAVAWPVEAQEVWSNLRNPKSTISLEDLRMPEDFREELGMLLGVIDYFIAKKAEG